MKKINRQLLRIDKMFGTLYGGVLGDILGSSIEMKSKHFIHNQHISIEKLFNDGNPTDDTHMIVAIMDSIVAKGKLDLKDISFRFLHWYETDGKGIGGLTRNVLTVFQQNKKLNLEDIAFNIWTKDNTRAGNGGIMRTSPLGMYQYKNIVKVAQNAKQVCLLTHADPRCTDSSIALSIFIAQLINGKNIYDINENICKFIQEEKTKDIIIHSKNKQIENLYLENNAGYTYTDLEASIVSFYQATSFENGLRIILEQGGDTDTNGMNVGNILGAKFGYKKIPQNWLSQLEKYPSILQSIHNFIKFILKTT